MTGSTHDVERQRLQTRADLSVHPLDDDLVIYDPLTGESYILNPTGRQVWERCNGERTVYDIAREIAALHGISTDRALNDVTELLQLFARSNLLSQDDIQP